MSASPKDLISLSRGDGTSAVVHFHGATLLSWKCRGQEMLFVSKDAVFDNKKAIRGGIPIVFPNFGPWKNRPQHGFARIKRWDLESPVTTDKGGNPTVSFSLQDDEETRNMWNMKFKLVYTIVLEADTINLTLSVENTDSIIYDFTCLLHTYLATPDISQTKVQGLQGLTYIDKLRNGEKYTEERDVLKVQEGYDRPLKMRRVVEMGEDGMCSLVGLNNEQINSNNCERKSGKHNFPSPKPEVPVLSMLPYQESSHTIPSKADNSVYGKSSLEMEGEFVEQAIDTVVSLPDAVSEVVLMQKDQSSEIHRQQLIRHTLKLKKSTSEQWKT